MARKRMALLAPNCAGMLAEVAKDWTNTPLDQVEKALFELRIG